MTNQKDLFNREKLRTAKSTDYSNSRTEASIQAAFKGGARASVHEQHHQNLAGVMRSLRELGHTITDVQHTNAKKLPKGMARSVIRHRSGKNKLKTVVRTAFNTDGGDHNKHIETSADEEK